MNPENMSREEKIEYVEMMKEAIVKSACNSIIQELFEDKDWKSFKNLDKLEVFEVIRQSSQLESKYSG
jgi:hypothetical protein